MIELTEMAFFSDDVEGMAAFYTRLVGRGPDVQSPGMAIFQMGPTKIFIHKMYTPDEGELPPENHTAFTVQDVDAACQALGQAGLNIDVAPKTYYWGRSAYLRDPDGHLIELIQAEDPEPDAS